MNRGSGTMSSDTRSPWETAIENLTGPWDLVVISAGVAAAAVAAALGPWSLEELLPVGAFGGMAILKGVQALQARRALRRRVKPIAAELSILDTLAIDRVDVLAREFDLWEKHATTNAEFSNQLDRLVIQVRSLWENEYNKMKEGEENLLDKMNEEIKVEKKENLKAAQVARRKRLQAKFCNPDSKSGGI